MRLSRDEIIKRMEQLKDEETLRFNIPEIFGGGVAVIGLNSDKKGKKYLLE